MIGPRQVPEARLHHIQLEANAPQELARFHADTLQMEFSPVDRGFLCSAPKRRVLFTQGEKRGLGFAAFAFETPQDLETYRDWLRQHGIPSSASVSPLFDSDAFTVTDPDGNRFVFGSAPPEIGNGPGPLDARLQHITLRSTDLAPITPFYRDSLGFLLADTVNVDEGDVRTVFFASDPEHHSLAVFKSDASMVDHHSYELDSWDGIKHWSDHFSQLGISLRWGPGRHGPGNNLFIFIEDPEGNWIELSAELEVLTQDRELKAWPHSPHSLNMWGKAIMRS